MTSRSLSLQRQVQASLLTSPPQKKGTIHWWQIVLLAPFEETPGAISPTFCVTSHYHSSVLSEFSQNHFRFLNSQSKKPSVVPKSDCLEQATIANVLNWHQVSWNKTWTHLSEIRINWPNGKCFKKLQSPDQCACSLIMFSQTVSSECIASKQDERYWHTVITQINNNRLLPIYTTCIYINSNNYHYILSLIIVTI